MKTLKDLERWEWKHKIGKQTFSFDYVCTHCLREEAIEWIKELKKIDKTQHVPRTLGKLEFHETVGEDSNYMTAQNVITWIKNFFNITEEDLK